MDRRTFLKRSGMTAFLQLWPPCLFASKTFRRRRPSDADWPSKAAWKRLNGALDGNLIPVEFQIHACRKDADGTACKNLIANIKNPYYIGEPAGLTQARGWVAGWSRNSSFPGCAETAGH